MVSTARDEFEGLCRRIDDGEPDAWDSAVTLVYDEMRQLASTCMKRERESHTLQTTALVHEAYLKLADQRNVEWQNRSHFLAIAAQAMRRVLLDHARSRRRLKRGGDRRRVELEPGEMLFPEPGVDLVALDEALGRLQNEEPDCVRVVELRFFGGLSLDDVAQVMGISSRTAARRWEYARTWLYRELGEDVPRGEGTEHRD